MPRFPSSAAFSGPEPPEQQRRNHSAGLLDSQDQQVPRHYRGDRDVRQAQNTREPRGHRGMPVRVDAASAYRGYRQQPMAMTTKHQAGAPNKPHGRMILGTEDEARRHIQAIRDEKVKGYQGGIAEDFKNALDVISNELYPNSADFLLEIFQNADDNVYDSSVTPKLWITYLNDDKLMFDTNEIGFSRADVEGICGVGRSSKKENLAEAARAGERRIGEKGIGFKAVFKVADEVFVKSGFYSFKFTDKDVPDAPESLLGRVAPEWADFPAQACRKGSTSILLKLRRDIDRQKLAEDIMKLDAKLLMFLNRVKEVEIQALWVPRVVLRREDRRDSSTGISSRVLEPDVSSPYILSSHPVSGLPAEKKRKGLTQSEMVLAIPHPGKQDDGTTLTQHTHKVYSFLPIRDYGFKFVLQADFVLVANRKEIDSGSEWNKALRAQLPAALLRFVTQLNHLSFQYHWPLLFPIRDEEQGFFEGINAKVLEGFSGSAIIESIDGRFEPASQLWLVPEELADTSRGSGVAPAPMIPSDFSQFPYASFGYPPATWDGLINLGVRTLSVADFLDDLSRFISIYPHQFHAMPNKWHSRLSTILDRLTAEHEETITWLRFVPLRDGTFVALRDGPLLFPLMPGPGQQQQECLQVPDKIGHSVVHADAAEDQARRKLLLKLGVRDSDAEQVCRLIIQAHALSSFAPEAVERAILIQHAEFLYKAGWRRQGAGAYLWVVLDDGTTRQRSSHVYLVSEMRTSLSRIARHHRGQFHFLHADYQAKFGTLEHRRFLVEDLRLAEIPRLVNPDDTATEFSLSADFRFLIDNLAALEVLKLLRKNWGSYCGWVVPPPRAANDMLMQDGGSPHERISDAIACMPVQLSGGRWVPLSQTCLPRKDVLAAFGLVNPSAKVAGEANARRSTAQIGEPPDERALAILPVPEPESFEWDMLEFFDVVVQVRSEDFIRRLRQLRQGSPTREEVAVVYEMIEDRIQKGIMVETLQAQFREEKLVFLPNHSPAWVALDYCLWEAPEALKKTPQLKEHYPEREWLFCRTLKMATTASLATAVEEAKRISLFDSLPYVRGLLQHINTLAQQTSSPRDALQPLRECAILPVWGRKPRDGFDYLSPPVGEEQENQCYIADKPYLRECFEGRAPLLAFDGPDLEKIKTLLENLDCEGRKLSNLARKLEPGAKGGVTPDSEYTKYMQERARCILCLIPKEDSNRTRLKKQLAGVQVYRVREITVVWEFTNQWGVTTQGTPERVDAMLDNTKADALRVYLEENAVVGRPPLKLVDELKTLCGIADKLGTWLSHILVSDDPRKIERELTREGLLVPGDDDDKPQWPPQHEDLLAPDHDGGSGKTQGPAQRENLLVLDDDYGDPAADPYDALPSADALTNSESHCGGYSPNVTRAGRGAAVGGGFENSARRGLAAFANLKGRLGQISRGRMRDPEPPRNKDYYYRGSGMQRVAMPVPPLEDIYEDEERQFAAELYVSDFLARTFPDDYVPQKHWTSHIRGRAGHKPVKGSLGPSVSTFTLSDSSGRLKQFLKRHGYRQVQSLADGSRFHIQVVFSIGSAHASFEIQAAQVAKAENLSLSSHTSKWRSYSEMYLLAFVYDLDTQPTVALFADPWQIKLDGVLSLNSHSTFEGHFRGTPPMLYAERGHDDNHGHSRAITPSSDRGHQQQPTPYQYKPLQHGEIRVLYLDADPNPSAPLTGSIQHIRLNTHIPPFFWALSYVWGAPITSSSAQHSLQTPSGEIIQLTLSLSLALRALRDKGAVSIPLWADAVCINQSDAREKALQVRAMRDVFGRAERVVAWLGPEYEGSAEAVEMVKAAAKNKGRVGGDPGALDLLLKRPWFARTWIVQEVVLAREMVLMCGAKAEVGWEEFFEGLVVCEAALGGGRGRGGAYGGGLLLHAGPAFALGLARDRRQRSRGTGAGVLLGASGSCFPDHAGD
ncbi:hypothetical protein MAPG_05269 [Magnaporthiopsis poae ATCC 64411]|uniref:Heterokaryon incompatibility domain-containing protein n=1 Tax=Magnaporthiopsis poae (strain ATCC 64411 / 73-15) TaxID=644358 RepID=A0A0C4DYY4_MAGP6|nr:hypothetical protein MAPG_05269 [Magnaporthiopsis poae ATCC 64411]